MLVICNCYCICRWPGTRPTQSMHGGEASRRARRARRARAKRCIRSFFSVCYPDCCTGLGYIRACHCDCDACKKSMTRHATMKACMANFGCRANDPKNPWPKVRAIELVSHSVGDMYCTRSAGWHFGHDPPPRGSRKDTACPSDACKKKSGHTSYPEIDPVHDPGRPMALIVTHCEAVPAPAAVAGAKSVFRASDARGCVCKRARARASRGASWLVFC